MHPSDPNKRGLSPSPYQNVPGQQTHKSLGGKFKMVNEWTKMLSARVIPFLQAWFTAPGSASTWRGC